jgi:hypothetical protein
MRTVILRPLACALVAVVVAGCGARNPPQITIVNNSTSAVTDVLLRGNGFDQIIDKIEPNSSKTVTVLPKGESAVSMEAVTPLKYITAKDVGYINRDGGYKVQITITVDYNIETSVHLSMPP